MTSEHSPTSPPSPPGSEGDLWAAVVTYERLPELAVMLESLSRQTKHVDHLVVVDNASDKRVRELALQYGAHYIDSGDNVGPAGGVANAMEYVLAHASDDDWLVLLDDDNPPEDEGLLACVWALAHERLAVDPVTGAAGLLGGRYRRGLGIWRRLEDEELVGAVPVDVIGGGYLPMYRCAVIRQVGTFDRSLFFGFEEGEFGQRLRSRGYTMYADGARWLAYRATVGEVGVRSSSVRTSPRKAAWRRYYGVRNATVIARRYGRPWTPPLVASGGAVLGFRALVRARRPFAEVWLPVRGAVDGLLGRMGRTVDPNRNTKEA